MKRICKYCGKTYEGSPGSSACPECVAERKKTTIRERVCKQCGKTFQGGPRAWYCPECRAERRREQNAKHKRTGAARPLGSIDRCEVCGGEYVVNNARQRYCPQCAAEAYRKADREQSKAWNTANTTPESRKAERKAAGAAIPCVACGKLFVPTTRAITCSPECGKAYQKYSHAEWEAKNREKRNVYQMHRVKKKEEAMSPEEYKDYRDRINARARENRRKRKEML